jgi:hypothetical protein
MNDFREQLRRAQEAAKATPKAESKPTSEMSEDELDAALRRAKLDALKANRDVVRAATEATEATQATQEKPRMNFLPRTRRRNWR